MAEFTAEWNPLFARIMAGAMILHFLATAAMYLAEIMCGVLTTTLPFDYVG